MHQNIMVMGVRNILQHPVLGWNHHHRAATLHVHIPLCREIRQVAVAQV